ncbi:hypothetical protein HanRHA438_Chr11g0510391 [Helianthus annuus]|nr:hypothetical protein HanRHA438_Chr11g0510391 [Helianthus annuus]
MLSESTSCPVLITKNFVSPVNLSVYTCPGELPQKLATKLFFQYRTLGNRCVSAGCPDVNVLSSLTDF